MHGKSLQILESWLACNFWRAGTFTSDMSDVPQEGRPPIPLVGPPLTFVNWCKSIYDRLRDDIPEMQARGTKRQVVFTVGADSATITREAEVWRVSFARANRLGAAGLAIDRHDRFTCDNTAVTIGVFFSDSIANRWKSTNHNV